MVCSEATFAASFVWRMLLTNLLKLTEWWPQQDSLGVRYGPLTRIHPNLARPVLFHANVLTLPLLHK